MCCAFSTIPASIYVSQPLPLELMMTAFAGLAFSLAGCLIGWISGLLCKTVSRP
jgi:hypothetical protein